MSAAPNQPIDFSEITLVGDDHVIPFAIEDLDTRGRIIQMGPALNDMISRHQYPAPVARLLGEMIVLTVLLGTSLKFDGQFIVQAQTDGPVNLLVVDFRTPGAVRAYARFDEDALAAAVNAKQTEPEQLLGKGILAMTVDQGQYMNRYQGMVPLEGNSLEDVAHTYFRQSEQIPTRVRLGVGELTNKQDGKVKTQWRGGGALIQFLPESEDRVKYKDLPGGDGSEDHAPLQEDNDWVEAQTLFATIKDDELTDPEVPAERLLFNLFHEQNLRIFEAQNVEDKCSCSGERIWSMLKSLSDKERAELVIDGHIEVKCEFCAKDYTVTPEELAGKA